LAAGAERHDLSGAAALLAEDNAAVDPATRRRNVAAARREEGLIAPRGPRGSHLDASAVGPSRPNFSLGPDVSFRGEAEVGRAAESAASVENDPGCVKTLRGIIAPGILGSVVMWRAKKRKNLSSARHYDQIRFRFRTTKTQQRHRSCSLPLCDEPWKDVLDALS